MFTVYKITNQINGKCYIGSSVRVEARWQEHKNCAFNPNNKKYQYPLYQAFRKYGLENFTFEIIRNDFSNLEEMQEYEYDMIIFYNSYNNGYNQTLNTKQFTDNLTQYIENISQPCAKVDNHNNIIEIYKSYHDAAQANFANANCYASRIRDICKGKIRSNNGYIFRDLDKQGKVIIPTFATMPRRKMLIRISLEDPDEEKYYNSISEAADDLTNGDRRQIQWHLQGSTRFSTVRNYLLREIDIEGNIIDNGISIEDKIKEYNKTNPCINGERHTIKDWCKIYNITTNCYYYRIKQGMTPIEAITLPKRK